MFCPKCYQGLDDGMNFCTNCGMKLEKVASPEIAPVEEGSNFGFGLLSFLEPIAGLIFFCVWKKNRPRRAKVCGINAIVSAVLALVFGIVVGIVGVNLIFNGAGGVIISRDYAVQKRQYSKDAQIVYDTNTATVIVAEEYSVAIRSRKTNDTEFIVKYTKKIADISVYNGSLAVAVSDENGSELYIYDITAKVEREKKEVSIIVTEIVIANNKLVFCDGDQWCTIYAWNFLNDSVLEVKKTVYQPALAINHDKGILYAVERGISSCNLYYINLQTMNAVSHTEFGEYVYNAKGVYFDGKNVHAFGCIFDAESGKKLSETGTALPVEAEEALAFLAAGEEQGVTFQTLLDRSSYAVIAGSNGLTLVYSYTQNRFVGNFNLQPKEIYARANGDFVAVCEGGVVATVDMGVIL